VCSGAAPWRLQYGLLALFIFAPFALISYPTADDDPAGDRVRRLVLRSELVLCFLTMVGGVLSVVGRVLQDPPSANWGGFLAALGLGIGSVVLGLLGAVAVQWLQQGYPFNRRQGDERTWDVDGSGAAA
jgi:hypothetical protein